MAHASHASHVPRVLVAHADHGVREVVAQALREAAGHVVVSAADAMKALATLSSSARPMVALLDERLARLGRPEDILSIAAEEAAGGPLARHCYILMSTLPHRLGAKQLSLLALLGAPVLALPFDLDTLFQMVDDAGALLAGRSHTQTMSQPTTRPVPLATPAMVAALHYSS
jgi:DNA-binding NtrC family response regulator